MFQQPSIPSILYERSQTQLIDDIPRADRIAIAIELFVDCIFLATYARQVTYALSGSVNKKSPSLVILSIRSCRYSSIPAILDKIQLNAIEKNIFNNFGRLIDDILNSNNVGRHIYSMDQIDACFDQSSYRGNLKNTVQSSVRVILAIANQIDLTVDTLSLPYIRIFDSCSPFNKSIVTIPTRFSIQRIFDAERIPSKLWYRIFEGLVLFNPDNRINVENLTQICLTINIGTVPDINSGFGILYFPYEAFYASKTLRKFITESGSFLYNKKDIHNALRLNNPDLFSNDSIQVSLEADLSDQAEITDEETDTSDQNDPGNEEDPNASPDDEVNPENPDPNDTGEEIDETDNPNDENTPSEDDGSNNTETRKTNLLGFDAKLATDETLDTFLYKVSVAKFIDNALEFNHDELPSETLAILKKWKSSMLFLFAAEETKRLLKALKLKF